MAQQTSKKPNIRVIFLCLRIVGIAHRIFDDYSPMGLENSTISKANFPIVLYRRGAFHVPVGRRRAQSIATVCF